MSLAIEELDRRLLLSEEGETRFTLEKPWSVEFALFEVFVFSSEILFHY